MSIDSYMSAKLGAEFLGTFMLIFTIGCNVLNAVPVWWGISVGCALMVSVYALRGISGANFNPSVSLALGISKAMGGPGMDMKTVGKYVSVQIAAGIVAAFCYAALFRGSFNLAPANGFGFWRSGLCEFLYTFMLCFVVLNVAAARSVTPNQYFGLAIGFVMVAGVYGAGAVSGGYFNPAVTIGIDVASIRLGFGWCIWYAVCQAAAGVAAALMFKLARPDEFSGERGEVAALTSEFLGTFMLVLTVGLSVLSGSPAAAYSIAASLMCMTYAVGDVSGAHFNPSVTLAIFLSGRCADLTIARAGKYMVVQLLGATAAGQVWTLIFHGETFTLEPGEHFGWTEVGVAETVFTFVLCFVVLCVTVSSATKAPRMFGLAIGACVTAGGNAIGAISGASLNPAVSWGIVSSEFPPNVRAALVYSLFEFVGAAAAAGVFAATHAVDLLSETPEMKALA